MPQHKNESPHLNRYENVDVLSLLDPNWLERSQASKLVKMVAEVQHGSSTERPVDPEPVLSL